MFMHSRFCRGASRRRLLQELGDSTFMAAYLLRLSSVSPFLHRGPVTMASDAVADMAKRVHTSATYLSWLASRLDSRRNMGGGDRIDPIRPAGPLPRRPRFVCCATPIIPARALRVLLLLLRDIGKHHGPIRPTPRTTRHCSWLPQAKERPRVFSAPRTSPLVAH